MASGVTVNDEVTKLFTKMRVVLKSDNECERVRLAIFEIKDLKEIVVVKKYEQQQLEGNSVFSIIANEMKEKTCFYALYDCHFHTNDGAEHADMMLLTWTSDCQAVKDKMIYASSKNSLKGMLKGVRHDMHMNDHSDWSRKEIADKLNDKKSWKVVKIEGVDI